IEIGGAQIGNPLLVANITKNKAINERYRLVGSMFGEIKFLKDFTFRANYYGDYDNIKSRSYTPIVNIYTADTDEIVSFNGNQVTRVNQNSNVILNFQQEYLLSLKKDFGPHGISATLGSTITETDVEGISGSVQGAAIPDDPRFWYVGV